jgi:hypothetical protein
MPDLMTMAELRRRIDEAWTMLNNPPAGRPSDM